MSAPALNPRVEARVQKLLSKMTLEEKIFLVHGNEFETHALPRLGIPALKMTDGPLGVRWGKATSFPAAIAMGASFDPKLVRELATAMSIETLAKGRDMLLGPCVNIARAPQGGRNFESYGEDPLLNSVLAATYVRALQGNGVMASTKHFAVNDQEHERMTIDVRVDERTLHEIHLPAFKAAIDAGTWSVMAAYNRVNGHYATANKALLHDLLKVRWNFKGFVVSDWDSLHDVVGPANAGTDLEMPNGKYWGNGKLLAAVRTGEVSEKTIDDKVRRQLRAMISIGLFERQEADRPSLSNVNSPKHQKLALKAATDGMVLLKNRAGLLPIAPTARKIAVIGPNAAVARSRGGGSSDVVPFYDVSPLEGLRHRAGKSAEIIYALGAMGPQDFDAAKLAYRAEYFSNTELEGEPLLTRAEDSIQRKWDKGSPYPGLPIDAFSARWTADLTVPADGDYEFQIRSDDGARLFLDDAQVFSDWRGHGAITQRVFVKLRSDHVYKLRFEYFENGGHAEVKLGFSEVGAPERSARAEALAAAKAADYAIVFVGATNETEGEGVDRPSLSMPAGQDELVREIAAVNPNAVVVLSGGGATLMPWLESVGAVVQSWYPGQEGGNAIADLLFGRANFTAKLPVSFYARTEDASSYGNYPGKDGRVEYGEGIYVGYRHLDTRGIAPLFPFGHGLSYTTFQLGKPRVVVHNDSAARPDVEVVLRVKNTGQVAGAEVVQLYVKEKKPVVDRPEQELKAFQKVWLKPGQTKEIRLKLNSKAFAFYNVQRARWQVVPGRFELRIGTSSREISAVKELRLR